MDLYRTAETRQEGDGFDVKVWVGVDHGYGYSKEPEVFGALMCAPGGEPQWVPRWKDDDDPASPAQRWAEYEDGWGSGMSRDVYELYVQDLGRARHAVEDLELDLIVAHGERQERLGTAGTADATVTPDTPAPAPVEQEMPEPEEGLPLRVARIPGLAWLEGHSPDGLAGLANSLGDQAEWSGAIPQLHRILAEPSAGHWFPEAPESGDNVHAGTLYWMPLLHMLLYRLGWMRPERGLLHLGMFEPADYQESHLALLRVVWESDGYLDEFHTFVYGAYDANLFQPVHNVNGFPDDGDEAPCTPGWRQDQIDFAESVDIPLPCGGGWDPLHLGHVLSAVDVPPAAPAVVVDGAAAHAVVIVDTMLGWYRVLHEVGAGLADSSRDWTIEVLCRGTGSLGTYRRSPESGIWHATTEAIHALGLEHRAMHSNVIVEF